MLKIAVTGNIASGKSLFENHLKNAGFKVLCLDEVTHFLYENSVILKDFLLRNFNTTKRGEIASVVFKNPEFRQKLEEFIYPLILNEMNNFFDANKDDKFLFVSAAMLFESGFNKYFDKIIFISADENIRTQRLIKRNNLSENEALQRIKSQMKEEDKKSKADFIIDNSSSKEALQGAAEDFIKSLELL